MKNLGENMSGTKDTYLEFTDGVKIRTSGKLRTLRRSDGYYVVGNGMCVPVKNYDEAQSLIASFEQDGK